MTVDTIQKFPRGLRYRPEIDGLRAIAVLAVVFYHAEIELYGSILFKGGFIGVDIFFVISGYLITLIIIKGIERGNFRILDFYERRVRRIIPALFFVILISFLPAWITMFPKSIHEYSQSVISSVLFSSNFFFWLEDSYFAEESLLKPFLHTWSLSLEEQFYLLFPPLLLLVWKYGDRSVTYIFYAGFFASVLLAEVVSRDYLDAGFYLLPTRIWELLAGALLAKSEHNRLFSISANRNNSPGRRSSSTLLPLIGLCLVLFSLSYFDDQMRHPSLLTLLPVFGVMLIIRFCGERDYVTSALSAKPMVVVGLISYSLYLWHYPIFSFGRIASLAPLDNIHKIILIGLAFLLAGATWKWIEKPFRDRDRIKTGRLISVLLITSLLIVGFCTAIGFTNGAPNRFSKNQLNLIGYELERGWINEGKCRYRNVDEACILGNMAKSPTWAILGDSHAETLTRELDEFFKQQELAAYVYLRAGCPLIKDVESVTKKLNCASSVDSIIAALYQNEIEYVVINDRGANYINGNPFDNLEGGREFKLVKNRPSKLAIDVSGGSNSEAERIRNTTFNFSQTARELHNRGITIFYVAPIPGVGWDAPKVVYHKLRKGELPFTTDLNAYLNYHEAFFSVLKQLESQLPNFHLVYPHKVLCHYNTYRCEVHGNDAIFYTDKDHLSHHGASIVVNEVSRVIIEKLQLTDF